MHKITDLKPGMHITNAELISCFKVGNSGGMRRSKAYNCLILICDHSKGLYDDRWEDEVLHYTGMGTRKDQSFSVAQNKTLFNSKSNGVTLYLFERFDGSKPYTFQGECELADEPYVSQQLDSEKEMRNVCMFPLRLKGLEPVLFDEQEKAVNTERKRRESKKLTNAQLSQLELKQPDCPGQRKVGTRKAITYVRNELVAEYASRRAGDNCQLCDKEAPFFRKDKSPYLEVHHVVWLSKGGADHWSNVVALCPNCHRKMHVIDDKRDVAKLVKNALVPLSSIGGS